MLVCGTNYGKIRVLKINVPIVFATSSVNSQNIKIDSQILTAFQITVHQ